jgi:hypothetical protein
VDAFGATTGGLSRKGSVSASLSREGGAMMIDIRQAIYKFNTGS